MFSSSHIPKRDEDVATSEDGSPVLYIGSFKSQLYIQENQKAKKRAVEEEQYTLNSNEGGGGNFPKVQWRPYLISADSRTPIVNHGSDPGLPLLTYDKSKAQQTALAVFQARLKHNTQKDPGKKTIFSFFGFLVKKKIKR